MDITLHSRKLPKPRANYRPQWGWSCKWTLPVGGQTWTYSEMADTLPQAYCSSARIVIASLLEQLET